MSDNKWTKSEITPSWKPEKEGDEIVGLLTEKEDHVGQNDSRRYTIEDKKTHEVLGVWGSAVLDTRMKNVKVGQEVKIVYKGKAKSTKRAGASYKDFDVFYRDAKTDEYDFDIADKADDIFNS